MSLGIGATDTTIPFADTATQQSYLSQQAAAQQARLNADMLNAYRNSISIDSSGNLGIGTSSSRWADSVNTIRRQYHIQIEEITNGYVLSIGTEKHYCPDKTALGEMVATQVLIMEQRK